MILHKIRNKCRETSVVITISLKISLIQYCNMSVKSFVDTAIQNNKVVVFSKSYCPYCKMAKDALKSAGLTEYFLLEIEDRDDCSDIQDYLAQLTKGRSVPRVFIGGKFVGGGSEMKGFQQSGKLKPMLQEVGAL